MVIMTWSKVGGMQAHLFRVLIFGGMYNNHNSCQNALCRFDLSDSLVQSMHCGDSAVHRSCLSVSLSSISYLPVCVDRCALMSQTLVWCSSVLISSVCFTGQSSKNVSSSPSIESLSGGREYTGSPPLSAMKKESFFSTISHSRSHSRSMSKKESVSEPYIYFVLYWCAYKQVHISW